MSFASLSPIRRASFAAIGATMAILILLLVGQQSGLPLIMAPFGASCVLLFAVPESPLAQPRSLIGGHLLTTAIGLLWFALWPHLPLMASVAVGLGIGLMVLSKTLHPPAGANPLLIFLAAKPLGWSFLLTPVLSGALLLMGVAWLYHRYISKKPYPAK